MTLPRRLTPIVAALGDTMFPAIEADDVGGGAVLPDALGHLWSTLSPAQKRPLGAVLMIFDLGAFVRYRRRFIRLDADAQYRYVNSWMRSRLPIQRVIYRTLFTTLANVFYQDARSWPVFGYEGPTVDRHHAG